MKLLTCFSIFCWAIAGILQAEEQPSRPAFRMVRPSTPAAAPATQPPQNATPSRVRLEADSALSAEETAAAELALQGATRLGRGGTLIRSGMQLAVTVLVQGNEEIRTNPQRINDSGRIALPLIQNVAVANMSLEEIEERLTQLYSDYFRNPHIVVEFIGSTEDPHLSPWGHVTLMGNVSRAGPVAVPPTQTMTVSGAIQRAGGLSASANDRAILVFRPDVEAQTVERISVDLRNMGRQGNHEIDIVLRAGDVVFVPERIF